MGLDFYGVDISASIIVPYKLDNRVGGRTGYQEYRLWINDTDTYLVPNALKDLAYVQDVTVQIGLGLNSKVSVTLAPPFDEGLELVHSPLINWAASELKVQIGYSTGSENQRQSMKFGGLMMKPDVRFGPNVSITLTALGVAYGMNLSGATSIREYPAGWSPWEAVKDTLQNHLKTDIRSDAEVFKDLTPDQMNKNSPSCHPFFKPIVGKKASTPAEHANAEKLKAAVAANVASKKITKSEGEAQTKAIDANVRRKDEHLPISKGPRNDWWFVREMVTRYGLDIVIRDRTVEIREPLKWKLGKPRYMFVMKGEIDTEAEVPVYPILDFHSPSAYVWLAPGSGGALIADVSPDRKQEVEKLHSMIKTTRRDNDRQDAPTSPVQFTAGSVFKGATKRLTEAVEISRTGPGAYNSSSGGPDAYAVFPGSPDDQRSEQVVSELRNYNNNRGIQCELTSIGVPGVLPADVVQVDGLAPPSVAHDPDKAWFNGLYGVMLVEHHIGTAGMTTKVKGVKNFFPGGMLAGVSSESELEGQVNKSSADVGSDVPQAGDVRRLPK